MFDHPKGGYERVLYLFRLGYLFKDDSQLGEIVSMRYMPYPVGDVYLGLTCK